MKQTAVDWLYEHLFPKQIDGFSEDEWNKIDAAFAKAKEMERQQKRKDFTDGYMHGDKPLNHGVIDKWYNETYGGNNHLCCTPIGQIKRYVNCIGCDRKPLTYGGNNE